MEKKEEVKNSDLIFCIENFLELPEKKRQIIISLMKNNSMEDMTINMLKEEGILLDEENFNLHRKINKIKSKKE